MVGIATVFRVRRASSGTTDLARQVT
jgi:hypothetical protein